MPPSLKNIPPEYFLRYARKSRTAAHLEHARLRRILRRALVPLRPRLPFRQMYISAADRVGKYELRTAGAYCPALPVMLALRCECELYGTTASQVKVLCGQGAQRGSMICFYGANLRALASVLLYYPEFSHKMRIPTRANKIFSDKTKSSLYRLLFSVRVELSSRAASVTLPIQKMPPWGVFR